MRRADVAILGLLTALLVSGGMRPLPERPHPAAARPGGRETVAFGQEGVALLMRRVNPGLSDRQVHRIAAAVTRYSAKYGIDPELVAAVLWRESSGRPWARSAKGAIGLMQVMPHMFQPLEIAGNIATIESNIEVGCLILADNIRRLGEENGILAYFWGSEIRGASYLDRVREARAAVRRLSESQGPWRAPRGRLASGA